MEANTEKIDRYLLNEMGPEEKAAFEKEVANDPALAKELAIQKELTQQLQRMGLKGEIAQSIKHIRLVKQLTWVSVIIAVALILGISVYLLKDKPGTEGSHEIPTTQIPASEIILPTSTFLIPSDKDTIIETPGGMMLAIPAGAFSGESNRVELQVQEALTALDIVKSGLSTTSDGELLQSAGMFSLRAFDGKEELAWKKEVSILVPTEQLNPNMMLFEGEVLEDGTVNWVDPKKIPFNLPVVPMAELDFYPELFIPTLKSMGEKTDKKAYTDSIYYSFSGYQVPILLEDRLGSIKVIPSNQPINTGFDFGSLGTSLAVAQAPSESDSTTSSVSYEIDPSRIKAFWNEEFNHTLLATKAFEERMRFIHRSCEPKFLEAYLSHLTWQMWEIDSLCMEMATRANKEKFRSFYQRKEGGVKLDTELQKSLLDRYQNKQKAWKAASEKVWAAHYRELDSLRTAAIAKKNKFTNNDLLRASRVFKDELCRNLKDAYQQIGGEFTNCNAPASSYYNVRVRNGGWKNLDQYVFAATSKRESMNYTDSVTGKKATLTYEPVEFKIPNADSFDRVLLYLLPDSLSSFQRIMKKEGAWKEKLNGNLKYRFAAIAYKGDDFYWYTLDELSPTSYTIQFEKGTEQDFQAYMDKNVPAKSADLQIEREYYRFEIQENRRLNKVRQQAAWRDRIARSIFPCMAVTQDAPTTPVAPAPSQ